MDETPTSTQTLGATAARSHRAGLWVARQHGLPPTASKADSGLGDDLCERISTSSSMEAQVDASDLASQRDLAGADGGSDLQEETPDVCGVVRHDSDRLLFAFMGCGAGGDVDADDTIIDELSDILLGIDIAEDVAIDAVAAVVAGAGVDVPVKAAASTKIPHDRGHETELDQRMRNHPTKRYDDLASYVADQKCGSGPPSEYTAPSLVLSARSTIEIEPPGTPRSKNGAGGRQSLVEELALQLQELRSAPERCKPPDPEIEHRPGNWQPAGERDSVTSTAMIPSADGPMSEQLENMNENLVSRFRQKDNTGGLLQPSSWDEGWAACQARDFRPTEDLPHRSLDVHQLELILALLEAEFIQCQPGQGASGHKSVAFDVAPPARTSRLGKRPQRDDDEEEDNNGLGGGPPKPRPPSKKSKQEEDNDLSLACPFWKENCWKHHDCIGYQLRNIKSLKQHLDRQHKGPEYYCPICGEQFRLQAESDAHVRAGRCREQTFHHEGMTADQAREIDGITSARKRSSTKDRWKSIFKVLFPESPVPENPYMERGLLEPLSHIIQFMREGGAQAIISDFFRDALENRTACEAVQEELTIGLFQRVFERLHQDMEHPQGISRPEVGLANRPELSSSNSAYDTSTSGQSQGTSSGRSSFPSTTTVTTVEEGCSSSASHTMPQVSEDIPYLEAGSNASNQFWGEADMPFPPVEPLRYDESQLNMNDGQVRIDEFNDEFGLLLAYGNNADENTEPNA